MVTLFSWKKPPFSLFRKDLSMFSLLNSFISNHYRKILLLAIVIACVSLYSLSKLSFNDHLLKWFSKKSTFRKETERVIQNLGGIFPVEFTLQAKKGVHDPEFIQNYLNLNCQVKKKHFLKSFTRLTKIQSPTMKN